MTLADSATTALAVTAVCAALARLLGALTTGGAVAGAVVGACVSLGFGLPGLAVLGTFFVGGTAATRVGWRTKKARGTAEAGEGRRDWKRVLGKGAVAAAIALCAAVTASGVWEGGRAWLAFCGAVAAALADTLGTEVGVLSAGTPRSLPTLRTVPTGTPGAVSLLGLLAATLGAAAVASVAALLLWADAPLDEPANPMLTLRPATGLHEPLVQFALATTAAGVLASVVESVAVGAGLRAPGFVRNLLTTAAGAAIGAAWRLV